MKTLYIFGSAAAMICMAAAGKGGGAAASAEFQKFDVIPPKGEFGARQGNSERNGKLTRVPVGMSFLEEITVPASITDPKEREASFAEQQRKLLNSVNGAVRRFTAANGGTFSVRRVNDDTYGRGVRVFRDS